MTLLEMVREYQGLLEKKESLVEETKANNAAIEAAKEKIAAQMVDDDCPSISTGGYKFTLQEKTIYSKRSEADIAQTGTSLFEVLREEGLGDIIVEQVNPKTLQSTMKNYVEEHGELSDELKKVIRPYDTYDIARRRETNRATKKGKSK
ncbi:MAG: hypothetical protein K2O18_06195 [Oscillospiraceae bacterium]|nr:hypothetical protein [Oscillospiraceae bacterium]